MARSEIYLLVEAHNPICSVVCSVCQDKCGVSVPLAQKYYNRIIFNNVHWHAVQENIDTPSIYLSLLTDKNNKGLTISLRGNYFFPLF